MTPETRYARSGEVHIAYQVVGEGSIDLVYVPSWISQVEHYWEEPTVARYFERLASFSRLIMFDRRGSGLSDHLPRVPTLEEQMDDVVAVMDAVGSERAAIFAWLEGGAMAALFAATHPERTTALVLYEAMARMSWAPDYDWALRREEREAGLRRPWGDGSRILALAPGAAGNQRLVQWFARLERLAASPGTAAKLVMMNADVDVRAILPSISVPTLVLRRARGTFVDARHARYLADNIPDAQYLELPGDQVFSFGPESDALVDEIEEFLTGARHAPDAERILATVMFCDVVDSTRAAAELGDGGWRDLLASVEAVVRPELRRFRGDSRGDALAIRARDPSWTAHGRDRADRRRCGGDRGAHRRPGWRHRGSGRGARVGHGQGPRGRLGYLFRGPWPARAARRTGGVEPVGGRGLRPRGPAA